MKIISEITKFERTVVGTKEFELDEKNPTYLKGRSGGSDYVAALLPINNDFRGMTLITSTENREGRLDLYPHHFSDWNLLSAEVKSLPHGEDILNWFVEQGMDRRTCYRVTDMDFKTQIRAWRRIN
jgi:hypothetical protein